METFLLFSLTSTFFYTSGMGKAAFAAWVWAIYFTFPGTFSTQPAATTQTFGAKHGGAIYGFLFTSDIVSNLLVWNKGVVEERLGWLGVFLVLAGFSAAAAAATFLFPARPAPADIRKRLKARGVLAVKRNGKKDGEGEEKKGKEGIVADPADDRAERSSQEKLVCEDSKATIAMNIVKDTKDSERIA